MLKQRVMAEEPLWRSRFCWEAFRAEKSRVWRRLYLGGGDYYFISVHTFKAVSLFWTLKSEFTNCLNHDGDKLVLWTVWWTGARSAGLCRVTVVQSGPIMFHLLACWEAGRGLQGRDIGLLSFSGTGRRPTGPEFLVVNGLIVHVLNFHVMGTSTTVWCVV